MMIKRLIPKFFFWLGIAILALAVLETTARLDDLITWKAPFFGNYNNDMLSVSDQYGWHNRPGAKYQKWEINRFGFRGPEITREKADGVIRVICLGASETFGLFESPGLDYPSQIQTMLDEQYPGRFQVLNASCPGMSPPRIVYYFNTWLKQFEPDIVTYYAAADFYLNIMPPSKDIITQEQPSQPPFTFRLADKLRIATKGFLPRAWQIAYKKYSMKRILDGHPADWVWSSPPPDRIALFREHMIYFIDQIRANRTGIVLATKANSISVAMTSWDDYNMTNWRYFHIRASEKCLLETDLAAADVLRGLGAEMGVPVADVAPLLPKSPEYFGDSGHLTNKGAAIVARAITEKILELAAGDPRLIAR